MKHPKTVADLTYKQITDLWMNEYQYFDSGEDHTTIPSEWPLAFHGGEVAMGDPDWVDDFIMQLGDDGAYRLDGVWGDIFKRVEAEPRLKKMITDAEVKRLAAQEERAEIYRQENEKRERERAEQSLKMNPWISVDMMPVFFKKDWNKLWLITDGNKVYAAQLSDNEYSGAYFVAIGLSIEIARSCTHWMPADRLLMYLSKEGTK